MLTLRVSEFMDPKVSPETLVASLENTHLSLEGLLTELNCTREDLLETLSLDKFADIVRLKVQLASVQIRLLAAKFAPHAVAQLVHLSTASEKPEVARRCATTVLNLAGIPTQTATQPADTATQLPPAPPPLHERPENAQQENAFEKEMADMFYWVASLKMRHNVPLPKIPQSEFPRLVDVLRQFIDAIPQEVFTEREKLRNRPPTKEHPNDFFEPFHPLSPKPDPVTGEYIYPTTPPPPGAPTPHPTPGP